MVSTHAPRECGIATFSSDLENAVIRVDPSVRTSWAVIDESWSKDAYGPEVRWHIRQGDAETYHRAAAAINDSDIDVVSIQHEFGLYGTWDEVFDDHLPAFLRTLRKPLITTFHTVLPEPSPSVMAAVRRVGDRSDAIIVMAGRAKEILEQTYGLDPAVLRVIPHGVVAVTPADREVMKAHLGLSGRSVISTFGLVDPRKGLEYMIEAMAEVVLRHPDAVYLVLGKTHPELTHRSGEHYRTGLVELVRARGLGEQIVFVDRFLSQEEILDYLTASDVYVTPYLDPNQITSGTLSCALGAGKAIVSTRYAHAVEALAEQRGTLVGFRDAHALADAVTTILDCDTLKGDLERNARAYGSHMAWPHVAALVSDLYRSVAQLRGE
ncbi:MAG: glycosyltransferase family 4 protein [Dehalococcoidia bacterium]